MAKFKKHEANREKWKKNIWNNQYKEEQKTNENVNYQAKKGEGLTQTKARKMTLIKEMCYKCENLGRCVDEYWLCKGKKPKKGEEEGKIDQENSESNSDLVMLIASIDVEVSNSQIWYLDTSCSNHMTGNMEWIIHFDASNKTSMKLVDNTWDMWLYKAKMKKRNYHECGVYS